MQVFIRSQQRIESALFSYFKKNMVTHPPGVTKNSSEKSGKTIGTLAVIIQWSNEAMTPSTQGVPRNPAVVTPQKSL
jgi:hypothetical protein